MEFDRVIFCLLNLLNNFFCIARDGTQGLSILGKHSTSKLDGQPLSVESNNQFSLFGMFTLHF
jgi:hypothetical protein